jgi:hypothetical protein
MKIPLLFCLFGVLMFFDCSSNNQKQTVNDVASTTGTNMQNLPADKKKVGDIEYTFSQKVLKKGEHGDEANRQTDVVQITYELKNTGDKKIKAITWEYVFFDPETRRQLSSKQFISKVKIHPGKEKTLGEKSVVPPAYIVGASAAGGSLSEHYFEQVMIRSIVYTDGSVRSF